MEERVGGPTEAKTTRQDKCKTRVSRKEGRVECRQRKREREPEEGRREGEGGEERRGVTEGTGQGLTIQPLRMR